MQVVFNEVEPELLLPLEVVYISNLLFVELQNHIFVMDVQNNHSPDGDSVQLLQVLPYHLHQVIQILLHVLQQHWEFFVSVCKILLHSLAPHYCIHCMHQLARMSSAPVSPKPCVVVVLECSFELGAQGFLHVIFHLAQPVFNEELLVALLVHRHD